MDFAIDSAIDFRFFDFFISSAHAQDAAGGGSTLMGLLPLIIIFVLFWFMLIRPQMKRAKEHKNLVAELSTGDEVVTSGGMLGRITRVGDNFIDVEIAAGTNIKVQKHSVQAVMPKGTIGEA